MQYTVTRGEKGKVEVKVDVPAAAFGAAYNKAVEDLAKEVKISGFRPGHVPADVVESQIGSGRILNEAANSLVSKHISEVFEKENIVPVTKPKIAVESLNKNSPFTFVVSLVQKPNVSVSGWKQIKVRKAVVKPVGDEDVDQSVKNIYEAYQKQKATKVTEEPKEPVESGKFIYDAHGNKIFIKDEESKSKSKVESQSMIDDEFAKKVGARDLAHLRELVRRDLETLVADQTESKLEEDIFEKMLEIGNVEVPDVLVDDELNRIMMRLNQELERQGRKVEDFLREENITMDALRAKWRPQAEKNVKTTLIMDEIGKQEKVQITKEELENAFKGVDESKLSEQQRIDLQQYIAVSLFQAKTLDLVKKAVVS